MSTFLQLCRRVAQESGTVSGNAPASVVDQTGRLGKIVQWTAAAWEQVQNLHGQWLFMRAEIPATAVTTPGAARYTPASWNITDLAEWLVGRNRVTMYLVSAGVVDEQPIRFLDWDSWRTRYARGVQTPGRPQHYSISPAGEFCFGPVPDDAFRINGEYQRKATILAANDDTPACPSNFHDIIVWKGLVLLSDHDEVAPIVTARAIVKYAEYLTSLQRSQLPQVTADSGPLA